MSATILSIEEIVSDSNVRRGQPIIAGTGIRVSDIVAWHTGGDNLTIEEVADHFKLKLGQVYAALAYYHIHQAEIDAQMQGDAAEAEQLIAELAAKGRVIRFE